MAINFEKYAHEGDQFLHTLARNLGHPQENGKAGILLRAVLHTIRDRITVSQSFHLLSQLPMFLKAIYVDNWKYHERPLHLRNVDEFVAEVKRHQAQYGEHEFNWEKSTAELVQIILFQLSSYISEGEFEDIRSQLPKGLKELFLVSNEH